MADEENLKPGKRGPEPSRLKLEGPWEDRVADSFRAPPPPKPAPKTAKKTVKKAAKTTTKQQPKGE